MLTTLLVTLLQWIDRLDSAFFALRTVQARWLPNRRRPILLGAIVASALFSAGMTPFAG